MTNRPLWLLDVDGPLNANKPGWVADDPRRTVVYTQDRGLLVRWAPALIVRIRGLLDVVEIRWATSWIGNTRQLASAIGLPDFEPAYPPTYIPPGRSPTSVHDPLKLGAALQAVRSGRRLIWTDDDAIPADGAAREELDAAGALLITPRSNRGLRPAHLDAIEAFASHLTGTSLR